VQRFYDASISVRQAAVDLVGRFALLTPDLFERYFEALAERLVDRGVSVIDLFLLDALK
jgi:cohesin loading factor subunit SCC2